MSRRSALETSASALPQADLGAAAIVQRGVSATAIGDSASAEALERLNRAAQDVKNQENAKALSRAIAAVHLRDYPKADKLALKLLEKDERLGLAWHILAIAREKTGDFASSMRAYEAALARRETGPILNELFRRAIRFGRRVRTHARPGTDRSLADPGVAWLLERLPAGSLVLAAGTGEMGRLLAHRIAEAGHRVRVLSHSAERGGALLERLRGSGHHLRVGSLSAEAIHAADAISIAVRTRAEKCGQNSGDGSGTFAWCASASTAARSSSSRRQCSHSARCAW